MMIKQMQQRLAAQEALLCRKNEIDARFNNGIYQRYLYPVLTREHVPLLWRFDFSPQSNPRGLERIGVNAVFNAGALYQDEKFLLMARIEGNDRKSYFAVAESESGVDGFRFWDRPLTLPPSTVPETNVYDMRLTKHEDGYIYGLFCTEQKDAAAPVGDLSSAVAGCGVIRSKDMLHWERLENIKSRYQQRNVVLHPEFVNGKYALYTRPSEGFVEVGDGGGIGFCLTASMEHAVIEKEKIIDFRQYHTIKEVKNGAGAVPIKTRAGWLHFAHGVRTTAAGLRYVIYCFVTDLKDPTKVIFAPGGYLIAPWEDEYTGDVSNVVFTNGAAVLPDGSIYLYYASADTRLHVAKTDIETMLDYCRNTPPDGGSSQASVEQVCRLIDHNGAWMHGD